MMAKCVGLHYGVHFSRKSIVKLISKPREDILPDVVDATSQAKKKKKKKG